MNTYEIINPSDAATLLAPEFRIAAAAVLVLAEGQYGAKGPDGTLPVLIFGSAGRWLDDTFGSENDFHEYLLARAEPIATALDSVMIGTDRLLFDEAMARIESAEARESYRQVLKERSRTSMTDLARRAWQLAALIRAAAAERAAKGADK